MKQEFKKTIPEELKKIIKEQYEIWRNYFNNFLAYKKWNDKYILERKSDDRVHIRSIFSILQNLYSIFVIDERKVSFFWSDIQWEDITRAYNRLAEYDYKAMNKTDFDFVKVYYWFIFWIWATRIAGWNKEENMPELEAVNSMWLILDPAEIIHKTKRRFIWISKKIAAEKITTQNWFFDIWQIDDKQKKLEEIEIYHHYTRYNEKVYLTTWLWEWCDKLIKVEEFSKNSGLWENFWFSLFTPWPIWNWQLWDLIELWVEYQKMLSQIINLMLLQAKKDVLWEDRLVNVNKVDIENFSKWTPGGRNIPVELEEWEALNNVLMQIPKEQWSQKASEAISIAEQLKQEATWVSPITQWMVSDQNMTKWEVQTLQANANMKFSLVMTFLIKSDIQFWMTWQAFYRQYFDWTKNIFLDNKFKPEYYQIKRKDLWNNFTVWAVVIKATSEINREKREKYQKMLAIMPNIVQFMSEENQKAYVRNLLTLSWFEKEEAESYIPEWPDEILARIDLERLNRWLDPSEPELGQKHEIFERIFMTAIPSEKVAKAIAERRMLRVTEWQQTAQWETPMENMTNMQNISQAQTMSKILNEDNWQNLITNQDILW